MREARYQDIVTFKYHLLNGLFLTLPFSPLGKYASNLTHFAKICEEELVRNKDPKKIVEEFFTGLFPNIEEKEKEIILMVFLQLIERQVVLFDAIEAAGMDQVYEKNISELKLKLKSLPEGKTIRLVLTAHPTQFYPESLLGIIDSLSETIKNNDLLKVRKYLLQMGHTSFKNAAPPTPYSEGEMLIDRFGPIFYETFLHILSMWKENPQKRPNLELGLWSGGDRDGHPFVTHETTLAMIKKLREFILGQYLKEMDIIKRHITFKGVIENVQSIRRNLVDTLSSSGSLGTSGYPDAESFLRDLNVLLMEVDENHEGLFRELIEKLIMAVETFGFYFAALDIRQNSEVFSQTLLKIFKRYGEEKYSNLKDEERFLFLQEKLSQGFPPLLPGNHMKPEESDLLEVFRALPTIHQLNGKKGLHRIILSHTSKDYQLLEALLLCQIIAGKEKASDLDFVPLFESMQDMEKAPEIMEKLFSSKAYLEHLEKRENKQTIMLGFSDGTKDGGYTTANWTIQKTKENLQKIGNQFAINIVFFDGRGGPPARGGGNTAKYYAGIVEHFKTNEIQQTLQGQTISSFYGTKSSARHNLLHLLESFLAETRTSGFEKEKTLMDDLSKKAHHYYKELRDDPLFLKALNDLTPLNFFGNLNVASRPPKRQEKGQLTLDNLRAIPFVGAWSLMKLNVPAFYGLGKALEEVFQEGKENDLRELYETSSFFQTLIGNASQALFKSRPSLTKNLKEDKEYGGLWKKLLDEETRTRKMILRLTQKDELLEKGSISWQSVSLREEIILPLLIIQHYALKGYRMGENKKFMEKIILKSIPPNINASRNSA